MKRREVRDTVTNINKENKKVVVTNLHKYFDDNEVLTGIDATIYEGEVVCVIGPSGSGKSTFLRCLNKLEDATSGEIIIDGFDITDKKMNINKVRENIGMVFQQFNLFQNMTVIKNIMMAPVSLKKMTKEEARAKAIELLTRVGLADKADSYPGELSGGQQQRVALARIMVYEPDLILLDEPFSALDEYLRDRIREEMAEFLSSYPGKIIIVSHSREDINLLSDRLLTIDGGRITGQGDTEDIFKASR